MEKTDICIIGAGAVGLAVAATLSAEHNSESIIVVERHPGLGQETSSRNSEVIHAGIYYPTGSLKAKLCVRGRALLYDFCDRHAVPYKKIGKLIVATSSQEDGLCEAFYEKARANGVSDIVKLSRAEVNAKEPEVSALSALFSPSTGIFDTHAYMKKLEQIAVKAGVLFAYGCEVRGIGRSNGLYQLDIKDSDGESIAVEAGIVVNCAGLDSDVIAATAGIDIDKADYRLNRSKGEYFKIHGSRRWRLNHLVYPVPGSTSLGIHIVLDLQGDIKLGPNAFFTEKIDYTVDPDHREEFYQAAKRYLPFVTRESLVPDMAGMRAKLQKPGEEFRDFVIVNEKERGLPGFINCIGIESPGLTSSLAIAEYVQGIL